MFGNDGLRLNILRGEIFPHYWENKEDKDFNLNDDINIELCDSDFNNKSDDLLRRGQLWLTLEAKNKYHINKLVFSTWSAPAWMKSNGKVSNGKLKPECYQDFANYLAAFYKAYKSKGITPYAISPSNEPGYAAPWNSSLWTADEMGKFITSNLGPTFQKENIPAKIIFGENPLWSVVMPQLKMVSSKDFTDTILQDYPEIKKFNLIAAGHGYSLSPDIMPIKVDKEYLKTPIIPFDAAEKAHIPVWITEISDVTPLDTSIQDGLKWAVTFHNYLTKANVNAIIWWGGAMPTSNNESLIILNKNRKDYTLSKRYDILGNYSRYISEGSTRIQVTQPKNKDLLVSAYKKNDKYILVAINLSEKTISTNIRLDGANIKGALKQLAEKENYETFIIPDNVGGRYSVLTPVGLLPIAVAGVDIDKLMKGARFAQDKYCDEDLKYNECYQYAVARNILYKDDKNIEILANYEPKMHYVTEWWKQLYGESEGKDGKGIFPTGVDFTTDLHSLGQYIQEGQRILFETALLVENPRKNIEIQATEDNIDGLNFLAGKTIDYVNSKAAQGTALAHTDGQVPNLAVIVPALDAYNFGKMVYFFEKACGLSGYLLGVNPFDQPGVEAYKKNMFALLGKPGYESEKDALEARLK